MRNLTLKEQSLIDHIRRLTRENGYAPSVRDLARAAGYGSTSTVQYYLDRLEAQGYLRRAEGKSRSILLCDVAEPRKIWFLCEDVIPRTHLTEEELSDQALPFAYSETIDEKAYLFAYKQENWIWVIAQGDLADMDKPHVFWKHGTLCTDASGGGEDVGVLLAKIAIF